MEEGLEAALNPKSRPRMIGKLEKAEAEIIALAKSDPSKGRKRWALRLLADEAVGSQSVESLSHESVRQILKITA